MTETVSLGINLQGYVRRESSRRWTAVCPLIAVVSQGTSAETAKSCLQEAVELWFESCIERGVLEQALREANFRPSVLVPPRRSEFSRRRRNQNANVLGEPFPINLTIPGYEAALLGATA